MMKKLLIILFLFPLIVSGQEISIGQERHIQDMSGIWPGTIDKNRCIVFLELKDITTETYGIQFLEYPHLSEWYKVSNGFKYPNVYMTCDTMYLVPGTDTAVNIVINIVFTDILYNRKRNLEYSAVGTIRQTIYINGLPVHKIKRRISIKHFGDFENVVVPTKKIIIVSDK